MSKFLRMNMNRTLKALMTVLLSMFFLVVTPSVLAEMVLDLEHIKAGDYEEGFGLGIYDLKYEGVGLYFNYTRSDTNTEPMHEILDIYSFGDPVTRRFINYSIINVGGVKRVNSYVAMYGGVGFGTATGIAQKHDSSHILASDGKYYVNDPANDEGGVNMNFGLLLGLGNLAVNVGYQTFTKSSTLGVGLKF